MGGWYFLCLADWAEFLYCWEPLLYAFGIVMFGDVHDPVIDFVFSKWILIAEFFMGCEDANDAKCGFPGYFAFPQVGIRSVFDQSC